MFEIDSRLKADTYQLGEWDLCLVLLNRDANYPWCILVPKRENILDWYQLNEADQQQLMRESSLHVLHLILHGLSRFGVNILQNFIPMNRWRKLWPI